MKNIRDAILFILGICVVFALATFLIGQAIIGKPHDNPMWYQKTKWGRAKKMNGYDSKFEAGYAEELELRKKAKDIQGFDAHVCIPLELNGYLIANYYIDFVVYHNDGTVEYVETKGYPSEDWKLKWKMFCALYEDDPNVKITLVMQGKGYKPRLRKNK